MNISVQGATRLETGQILFFLLELNLCESSFYLLPTSLAHMIFPRPPNSPLLYLSLSCFSFLSFFLSLGSLIEVWQARNLASWAEGGEEESRRRKKERKVRQVGRQAGMRASERAACLVPEEGRGEKRKGGRPLHNHPLSLSPFQPHSREGRRHQKRESFFFRSKTRKRIGMEKGKSSTDISR